MITPQKIVMKFSRYMNRICEREKVFSILDICTFDRVINERPDKIHQIAIVIPNFTADSGGGTSIMRIGRSLSKKGADITYVIYDATSEDQISHFIDYNSKKFGDFPGTAKTYKEAQSDPYDVCIATDWSSVYYAKKLKGYKFYFVQDYEPYFHNVGDEYVLARETYRLGFHIISLGNWNLLQIQKNNPNISCKMNYIDFPYESKEYPEVHRNYNSYHNKKEFKFAVYIKSSGRRLPYLIQFMMKGIAELFKKDGIILSVKYYGLNKKESVIGGENLGRLTRKQLFQLYKDSDFGMVASLTNISLVPYEMLATGLPVIEFKEGSFPYFLGEETAILTGYDYHELYEILLSYINNPQKLDEMHKKAKQQLANYSWEHSCSQFWDILNGVRKDG